MDEREFLDYDDYIKEMQKKEQASNEDVTGFEELKEPETVTDSDLDKEFDLNSFYSGTDNSSKHKKTESPKTKKEKIIRNTVIVFLALVITVSIVVGSFLAYVFTSVDGTMEENLNDLRLNFTTTIYSQNEDGEYVEYQRLHGMYNRIWKGYDRVAIESGDKNYDGIPENLVNAFVAIEDKRFFDHDGVDWKRTIAAFGNMFLHYSSNFGGSTITQQLVKNLTGDNEDVASRKIREIMRARYIESQYTKDTIVECYLNTIPMGHGIYGVEVAANYYFDKSVSELSLVECAALASITNNPSKYVPDDKPEGNKDRRNLVLKMMYEQDYISESEYQQAIKSDITVTASRETLKEETVNNYYVEALIRQVTKDLAAKYGYDESRASNNFYNGGYKIYATVKPEVQSAVDKVFSDAETYGIKSKKGSQLQGAITVMDYNGNVLGMAGGIGEKTANLGMSGFNRATDAIRQPGSTMKPLSAYSLAIEKNEIHYSSIVNDTATTYHNGWKPKNWYNSYWGHITVQYALERSVNTIPVYLVNKMGTQTCFDFITQRLGVKNLNKNDVDLSPLGMGGTNGGLSTLESASAFAVFGNGGVYYEPVFYSKVVDQHGDVILQTEDLSKRASIAVSESTATVMNHLLQGVVYGGNGTGKAAASYVPNMKIYAKTGTSNDQYDLWFVGGTPYYIASCWCGYDTQQTISKKDIAQKMWGNVMKQIHKGLPEAKFIDSPYATCQYYCTQTGQLATSSCPKISTGWYKRDNIPSACKKHAGTVLDAPSNKPKEESTDKKDEKTESTDKKDDNKDTSSQTTSTESQTASTESKPTE